MTTVQHCILGKGAKVFSIGSDDTVEDALTMETTVFAQ